MTISLIICTYMRPQAIITLLDSIEIQVLKPEVIIVDGSTNTETQTILSTKKYGFEIDYYLVDEKDRGLTRQRNFGVSKLKDNIDIVCFLDDDVVLEKEYFQEILNTYQLHPNALAVGGCITNEVSWKKAEDNYNANISEFYYDGYVRNDGSRFVLRKKLGLDSDVPPGYMPEFSNGRCGSTSLPPSGKTYQVEHLIGCLFSFKKSVFDTMSFSTYFEGYGLYEDADFTLRVSKKGELYINTKARLAHYHNPGGRPNKYKYGKMVIRNGWYVWRVKYSNPSIKAKLKWNFIAFLLTIVRFTNVFTTNKKQEAFTESLGRFVGWASLIFNKPKIER